MAFIYRNAYSAGCCILSTATLSVVSLLPVFFLVTSSVMNRIASTVSISFIRTSFCCCLYGATKNPVSELTGFCMLCNTGSLLYWDTLRSFSYLLLIIAFANTARYGYRITRPVGQFTMICHYHKSYGRCFFLHSVKTKKPAWSGAFVVSRFRSSLQITW